MQKFTVHWSQVSAGGPDGRTLFALWPAPMNDDACFRDAGFTDFGDGDELWDVQAGELLSRLLAELTGFGAPRPMSEPVERNRPLFSRLFSPPAPLTLREEIEARTISDEFPACAVAFGESGVTLRTADGHHIFWVALPHAEAASFTQALSRISGEHPLVRTDLKWDRLLPRT